MKRAGRPPSSSVPPRDAPTRMGAFIDPLEIAFAAAQQAYKAGLYALVNAKRRARELAPVEWPTVGGSPHDEMWRDGAARLLRYRAHAAPAGAHASASGGAHASASGGAHASASGGAHASASGGARPAVLLVASLINRPWVLDLLPGRSVAGRLLSGGCDVWLLDWGTPRPEDSGRSLAGYALDLLPRAFDEVARASGAAPFILGYCMGGTLSLAAAGARRITPAGLITLATPVAFHDEGLLSRWCRTPGFDPSALHQTYGNIPPHLLQPAFKMLDPVGLMSKWVHLDGKIEDDDFLRFFLAMESWLEDSVSFPGAAFVDWIELYRSDALARGALRLAGEEVDLSRVRCPVLNVVAEKDYITPAASSEPLERLVGGAYAVERIKGGHIGLSTGGEAHRRLWPSAVEWMRSHAAARAKGSARTKTVMQTHQKDVQAQPDMMRSHQKVAQAHSKKVQAPQKKAARKTRPRR